MAARNLDRRLNRLERDGAGHLSFGAALEAACRRRAAWRAAGNTGPYPSKPWRPAAPNATRAEREMWRKLTNGWARVLARRQPSLFRDLREIYVMSDAELLEAINRAESAGGMP